MPPPYFSCTGPFFCKNITDSAKKKKKYQRVVKQLLLCKNLCSIILFYVGYAKHSQQMNNCNTPTQIAELIKYLNEVATITVIIVSLAFLSFEKNLISILIFSTLLTSMPCVLPLSAALIEIFLKRII